MPLFKRNAVDERLINTRGFTLIEVLIATLLFSVAMLGLASLATVIIKSNDLNRQITTATTLAQQKMEDYINKGYVNISTGTEVENFGQITDIDGSTALFSGFKRVSDIQDVLDSGNHTVANMRKLTVTVYMKQNYKPVSFSTLIAK